MSKTEEPERIVGASEDDVRKYGGGGSGAPVETSEAEAPSGEALTALLRPAPADAVIAQAVGRHVNNARHDDPVCIEPAADGLLL